MWGVQPLTYLIKVERIVAGYGAIQAGLEERCPTIAETMRASLIPFADACNARINRLK